MTEQKSPNDETREAWDANAEVWDAKMADMGNDFVNLLQWPVIEPLLNIQSGQRILDIACGNGLLSRRLAALDAKVTAIDFSSELVKLANNWDTNNISYHVMDATNESELVGLGESVFDSALCNMALFDIADIAPLFRTLPRILKPGGCFVFSLTHPAFNNSSSVHIAEEWDEGGVITRYSVKISRYMTPYQAHGIALRDQPRPQLYFERPIQYYLKLGFENGFVVDGFDERAFPENHPQSNPLSWGGNFSEIPPVLVVRMRLMKSN
jgi:2-polyprenyl-3-methyl-5-hydroxy-6-metoxy-1,4-benzoquinol methylase